ncbi:MAG: RNA 2',3'-cyclic phosphodiesterase [Myxococcaceae bacterium]|nr:RNA 2',3'-cyclic phosphodiesterase [Myxococcaceae bacterium]
MSIFVAIELGAEARAAASHAIARWSPTVNAKWQQAEKLHLTVVFLGNPKPDGLAEKLDVLASRAQPFTLKLHGAGTFVTERAASVLWLGVGGELEKLHALEREAANLYGDSGRPYVPHVTLARAQTSDAFAPALSALNAVDGPGFQVTKLTLFESTHHQFRSIHESPLHSHA